jgi:hypothetical protein
MDVYTLILAGNGFFSCASQHGDSSEQLVKSTSERYWKQTTYNDNGTNAVNAVGWHALRYSEGRGSCLRQYPRPSEYP